MAPGKSVLVYPDGRSEVQTRASGTHSSSRNGDGSYAEPRDYADPRDDRDSRRRDHERERERERDRERDRERERRDRGSESDRRTRDGRDRPGSRDGRGRDRADDGRRDGDTRDSARDGDSRLSHNVRRDTRDGSTIPRDPRDRRDSLTPSTATYGTTAPQQARTVTPVDPQVRVGTPTRVTFDTSSMPSRENASSVPRNNVIVVSNEQDRESTYKYDRVDERERRTSTPDTRPLDRSSSRDYDYDPLRPTDGPIRRGILKTPPVPSAPSSNASMAVTIGGPSFRPARFTLALKAKCNLERDDHGHLRAKLETRYKTPEFLTRKETSTISTALDRIEEDFPRTMTEAGLMAKLYIQENATSARSNEVHVPFDYTWGSDGSTRRLVPRRLLTVQKQGDREWVTEDRNAAGMRDERSTSGTIRGHQLDAKHLRGELNRTLQQAWRDAYAEQSTKDMSLYETDLHFDGEWNVEVTG